MICCSLCLAVGCGDVGNNAIHGMQMQLVMRECLEGFLLEGVCMFCGGVCAAHHSTWPSLASVT